MNEEFLNVLERVIDFIEDEYEMKFNYEEEQLEKLSMNVYNYILSYCEDNFEIELN